MSYLRQRGLEGPVCQAPMNEIPLELGPHHRRIAAPLLKSALSDRQAGLLLFALFLMVGSAVAFKSMAYGWFWDDLHLVRPYSWSEITGAVSGLWDPDAIETPGYRPMTTLFNHLRGSLLGESLVAHRLLSISLFAGYLSFIGLVARRLGVPLWQAGIAGVIALVARGNLWNLVFISDGVHALTGLFFALSLYLFLLHMKRPALWRISVASVCTGLSLLTREDSLSVIPLIPLIAAAFVAKTHWDGAGFPNCPLKQPRARTARTLFATLLAMPYLHSLVVLSLVLCLMTAAYWLLRQSLVPSELNQPNARSWLLLLEWAFTPMGRQFQERAWLLMLVSLVSVSAFMLPVRAKLLVALWLGCTIASSSIGLVAVRPNLLFFPISFLALALATATGEFARLSRGAALYSLIFLAILVSWSARLNWIQQESVHPLSIQYLSLNGEFIWGQHSHATIPPLRRAQMMRHYASLGIYTTRQFDALLPVYHEQARANGWDRPNSHGHPFIPRIGVLAP